MKTKVLSFFVALLSFSLFVPNAYARRICYYYYFDNTIKHQYEDENVRVYITSSSIYVSNKTDKIIYIDRLNSFAILNGSHDRIFKNTDYTDGGFGSSGVGVNLGMVSPYLSGITVSGNSGTYYQKTTHDIRIIPLPPHSYTEIYTWAHPFALMAAKGYIKDNGNVYGSLTPRSRYIERGKKIKLTKGFTRTYDLSTSPLRYKALVKYALSEDMTKGAKEVQTSENYLKAMVADSYKGWKWENYRAENLPYCQPFMADPENYVCWLRYKEGARFEDLELLIGAPIAGAIAGALLMWMIIPSY